MSTVKKYSSGCRFVIVISVVRNMAAVRKPGLTDSPLGHWIQKFHSYLSAPRWRQSRRHFHDHLLFLFAWDLVSLVFFSLSGTNVCILSPSLSGAQKGMTPLSHNIGKQ